MDFKKGIFAILFLGVFLCFGCATAKGIGRAGVEIGKGVAKDTEVVWKSVVEADQWFRENLW